MMLQPWKNITAAALICLLLSGTSEARDVIANLETDWVDGMFPPGWDVREDGTTLTPVDQLSSSDFTSVTQPGFEPTNPSRFPFYFKTEYDGSGFPNPPNIDWIQGDIILHTDNGPVANIIWTSTIDGLVDIEGSLWNPRNYGRSQDYWVTVGPGKSLADALRSGSVNDSTDRASRETFGATGIAVNVGDEIALNLRNTPGYERDYVGISFTVYSETPAPAPAPAPAPRNGGGFGDPHVKKWDGQWYDFHGICDLVLLDAPSFANGIGLSIHIRTKARYEYSYIESAVVKIGNNTLEVGSWGEYWFDGVEGAGMPAIMDKGFVVTHMEVSKKKDVFAITLDDTNQESIVVSAFKDMVSVSLENATATNFASSTGLMGNFADGSMLARDGKTVMTNLNLFGKEWQVLESEPMLFQSPPKNLGSCDLPISREGRRRLGETIAMAAAEKACVHYKEKQKQDMCIFDVMAMGDLEVAGIGDAHGAFRV